ncbi:MAG: class I SAM-dependent methyltransferase [Vicinamibacteraceae bacterium]|nr:class I SAM-dependent methyltransferase [Vicinamibacteraceae bacterium]
MDDGSPDRDELVTRAVAQLRALGLSVDLGLVGRVPNPPRELVLEFNHPDKAKPAVFIASGWRDLCAHAAALRRSRARFIRAPDVLDFGCGAGRLLRIIQGFAARVVAADISARAVSWCSRCPGVSDAVVVPAVAPADQLKTASADWAIANSVFTHIPVINQRAWLEELARVLRPGGTFPSRCLVSPMKSCCSPTSSVHDSAVTGNWRLVRSRPGKPDPGALRSCTARCSCGPIGGERSCWSRWTCSAGGVDRDTTTSPCFDVVRDT